MEPFKWVQIFKTNNVRFKDWFSPFDIAFASRKIDKQAKSVNWNINYGVQVTNAKGFLSVHGETRNDCAILLVIKFRIFAALTKHS